MRTLLNGKSLTGQEVFAAWMNYSRWNNAIANSVFDAEMAGRPVFIDLDEEALQKVAIAIGIDASDARPALLEAVTTILNRTNHPDGVFARVMTRLQDWKRSGDTKKPPPMIAVLAVLCLAAEDMAQGDGLGANNYYDRLMPLLGVTTELDKKRIIEDYRQVSHEIWESLNQWLEDLQGERGLPTAYSFSHVHIGRPLSQALIRTNDRKKLRHFFQSYGLAPHSRLSAYDMQILLNEWLHNPSSAAPKGLRNLWKKSSAKERITEVACSLLELWDGPTNESTTGEPGGTRASQLGLQALLRTFPSSELEINIVGHGAWSPGTVADVQDLENGEVSLSLEPVAGGRFRLADAARIDTRSLFEGRFSIRIDDNLFERRPRRIVPLRKDHLLQTFVEVERLPLGEDSILLAQEGLAQRVEEALSIIARPGFRRVEPLPKGCPQEWALFADVQILSALPPLNPNSGKQWHVDFNVLQPIGTTHLAVEGGLQIPGRLRQWSSLAPPEVRVTSDSEGGLVLSLEQVRDFGEEFEKREWEFPEPVALMAMTDVDLPDGDYLVEARTSRDNSQTRSLIDQVRVRLRSGAHALPVPSDPPPPHLVRPLDSLADGVISARWLRGGKASYLRGALVHGVPPPKVAVESVRFETPEWVNGRKSSALATTTSKVVIPAADIADCYHTGSHNIVLPIFDGKVTQNSIEGVCRKCGLTKRYPSRFQMKWKAEKAKGVPQAPSFDVSKIRQVVAAKSMDPDVALDTLTFLRSGTGTALEQLALQVEPSRLFADRFLRALEVLGHLEVSRDQKTFAVKEWELVPTHFVELCSGSYALTGGRSRSMRESIEFLAEKFEVQVQEHVQAAAPSLVELNGDREAIRELSARLSESLGAPVELMRDAASTVANLLPSLSEVVARLPEQSMPAFRHVRRWNPSALHWDQAGDASSPGIYQLQGAGTAYCIRDSDNIASGTMRRGDARLVKHAEALRSGAPLVAYIPEKKILLTPLGADLPLLYGRAAVMASGRLPVENLQKRVLLYGDVPQTTASRIISTLSS